MIPTKNDRIGFGGGRDVRTMLSVVFQIHFYGQARVSENQAKSNESKNMEHPFKNQTLK